MSASARDLLIAHRRADIDLVATSVIDADCYRAREWLMGACSVVDVGAHIGAFACWAASLGAREVVAIECDPDNYELLAQNAARFPAVRTVHATVVGRRAPLGFRFASPFSNNTGIGALVFEDDGYPVEPLPAPAVRLDDLLPSATDVLKMDIEGGEYDLLADSDLPGVRRVIVECHRFSFPSRQLLPGADWVRTRLRELGFIVADVDLGRALHLPVVHGERPDLPACEPSQ